MEQQEQLKAVEITQKSITLSDISGMFCDEISKLRENSEEIFQMVRQIKDYEESRESPKEILGTEEAHPNDFVSSSLECLSKMKKENAKLLRIRKALNNLI